MRLIDSHGHVNAERFTSDAEAVVERARQAGVERLLVPGWNVASSERAIDLVERIPWLDVGVGVHPHDAADVGDDGWRRIVELAGHPAVVAIGETGLDYDRAFSPIPAQLANLRRNLDLARETRRPVILHCRSAPGRRHAQDALLAELTALPDGERPLPIIHSFSGPVDYAERMLQLGAVISFSGLVFRAGEEASAEVAALTPLERLLVETDAPFLSPPGAPRRRNEPGYVGITAAWVAERRGIALEALGEALVTTYDRVIRRRPSSPVRSAPASG